MQFKVIGKSTPALESGTLIDYSLKIRGVPVRWQSRIESWEKNTRFVDTQVKGPYAKWHHTHTFTPLNGGTLMTDTVVYALPLGAAGNVAGGWMVKQDLEKIFNFRRRAVEEVFA